MSCLQRAVCRRLISLLLILVCLMVLLVDMCIRSDGSEAFILGKILLDCYLLHLVSMPLLSSPFHPQPHPLGVLSNACYIFLSSFTLWALQKLLSSPTLINAIFSFVHSHSNSQCSVSPHFSVHLTLPPLRDKEKMSQI